MSKPHNFKGRNSYRLKDTSTRKEAVFSKTWREYNQENPNLLKDLLGEEPTQEQIEVLCTLVQWFGTSKGFKLLDEIMRKCTGMIKV